MYLADEAVIVTNPEVSSCRDSDKMVGFISSKSRRAETDQAPVRQTLLVTRYGEASASDSTIFPHPFLFFFFFLFQFCQSLLSDKSNVISAGGGRGGCIWMPP